jgi:hypothetical protein
MSAITPAEIAASMRAATDNLPLTISWFPVAIVPDNCPAIGDPERTTWGAFTSVFEYRREGDKDGCCFAGALFRVEADGRHVRRKKAHLLARTAIALDIETNKETGEVPPSPDQAIARARALGFACLVYTSHSNRPGDIRYRAVLPLSGEIPHDLPAPEVMAEALGLLGVLDTSKIGAESVFYLPSCPYGALDLHQTIIIPGAPIDAAWIMDRAGALQAARQAEAERIAAEAQAEAAARREAKI